jgi:hypothetical protein
MKRIIYDVPKWSLYLHRAARELHRADATDPPDLKLGDELFERLFAGEAEAILEPEPYALLADWAQRIHDTVTQLPAFERLAAECRGRADESAMAVEALMNEMKPDDADDVLRRSARAACGKASAAVEQLRDAMEGLEHVAFGAGVGSADTGAPTDGENVRSWAGSSASPAASDGPACGTARTSSLTSSRVPTSGSCCRSSWRCSCTRAPSS